jgi:hypothetical protein
LHASPFVLIWNLYAEVPDLQGADSYDPETNKQQNVIFLVILCRCTIGPIY